MREYKKQKEKLELIEQECVIEWVRRSIATNNGKLGQLSSDLAKANQYLQALEAEKGKIMVDLSQPDAWTKSEGQIQTLNLLDINSK